MLLLELDITKYEMLLRLGGRVLPVFGLHLCEDYITMACFYENCLSYVLFLADNRIRNPLDYNLLDFIRMG